MKKETNMEPNVEQEVASYFDSENNVEKNQSIETLKILDSVGDPTSNDGRRFARQFATERAKTFPLKASRTSLEDFYNELIGTFPWAKSPIEEIVGHLCISSTYGANPTFLLPPLLLVGDKGTGKTTLLKKIAELTGIDLMLSSGAVSDSGGLLSVARGWSTSRPSGVFSFMVERKLANPIIFIDELDKAQDISANQNGNLQSALLSMIGSEKYYDNCLLGNLNFSRVSFVASANDETNIYEPLLDRFLVLTMPKPQKQHIEVALRNIECELKKSLNCSQLPTFEFLASELRLKYSESGNISLRQLKRDYLNKLQAAATREAGFNFTPSEQKFERENCVGFALH